MKRDQKFNLWFETKKAFIIATLIIISIIAIQGATAVPNSNDVIGYYSFDNTATSGNNLIDLRGLNNATLYGNFSLGINGKYNQAVNLSVSGTGGYFNVSPSASTNIIGDNDLFSINLWANIRRNGDTIFTIGKSGATDRISISVGPTRANYIGIYTSTSGAWKEGCLVDYNTTTMFTITLASNGTTSFYKNGILCNINTTTAPASTSNTQLVFGAPWDFNNAFTMRALYDEVSIWNSTISSSDVSYLYNNSDFTAFQQYPFTGGVFNFSITARDIFDSSSLTNFSANVSGTIYSTTSGTITTSLLNNATSLQTITIFNANNTFGPYFNRTYSNYNVSSNLQASLSQTEIRIQPVEKITNNSLSGSLQPLGSGVSSKFSNETFNFKATSYNVTFLNASYSSVYNKTQQFSFTPLQNTTINLTDIYNAIINITAKKIVDNTTINIFQGNVSNTTYNYFETFTTTNGFKEITSIKNINSTINIDANNYTNYNNTGTKYAMPTMNTFNLTFYLYTLNTINLLFYDQATDTKITWQNISFDLISSIYANNYTTSTGNYTIELLSPSEYTLRYSAPSYTQRFYYFTLTNNTFIDTTLYLINKSQASNISIIVLDQGTRGVENAYVKALKYDLPTNSYKLQEIGRTNIEGETILTLTKFNEYYKFIIEYNGEILLTSNPAYIVTDSLTFQINIGQGIGQNFFTKSNINYLTSFNTNTNNFRLEYSNIDNLGTQVCFYTYKLTGMGKTLTNSTCSTSSTATLLLNIPAINGTTYIAESYYLSNSQYYPLDSMTYQYGETDYFGKSGLILQILLSLIFVLGAYWKPSFSVIAISSSLLIGKAIGFITLGYEFIVPVLIVGIIIAVMLKE